MSGIAVDGWVMPQSVKQVRGISKFALPPTFKKRMVCLLTKMYLVHYLSKMVNVMGMKTNEHAWCVIFDLVINKLVPIFFFFFMYNRALLLESCLKILTPVGLHSFNLGAAKTLL